jgi:small subunit ribosomal protein S17
MPKKELVGKVVSNKMQNTVVVAVENYFPHPKYEKQIVRTKKFQAHDAANKCQIGDVVRIQECPPISKMKHFQVLEIVGSKRDTSVAIEEGGI